MCTTIVGISSTQLCPLLDNQTVVGKPCMRMIYFCIGQKDRKIQTLLQCMLTDSKQSRE